MKRLVRFAIYLGVLVSIAGFLGGVWWVFDLFANFRPQLAVGGLLLGLIALLLKMRAPAFIALFAVAPNVAAVAQLYLSEPANEPGPANKPGPRFTVLSMNVNRSAGNPELAALRIREQSPDIVGLIEVDERWMSALRPTLEAWPFKVERLRGDNFGIALYSKTPLSAATSVQMGVHNAPFLVAETTVGGRRVGLVVAHPPPPINSTLAKDRDEVFSVIAARPGPQDRVVLGDFNATPWSTPFRQMLTTGDLRLTRQGLGLHATWPAALGAAGIPIDHILIGGRLVTVDHQVLEPIGSDHLPILAKLGCPPVTDAP